MTPIKEYEDFSNYLNDMVFYRETKKNLSNVENFCDCSVDLNSVIVSQSENCYEDYFKIRICFSSAVDHKIEESNLKFFTYEIRRATFEECYNLFNKVKIKKDDDKEAFEKLDKIVKKYFSCVSFMFGCSDEESFISDLPLDVVNIILKIAAEPYIF